MTLLSDEKYQLFLPAKTADYRIYQILHNAILCWKRPFLDGYNCTTLVVLSHSTLSDRLNKVHNRSMTTT